MVDPQEPAHRAELAHRRMEDVRARIAHQFSHLIAEIIVAASETVAVQDLAAMREAEDADSGSDGEDGYSEEEGSDDEDSDGLSENDDQGELSAPEADQVDEVTEGVGAEPAANLGPLTASLWTPWNVLLGLLNVRDT